MMWSRWMVPVACIAAVAAAMRGARRAQDARQRAQEELDAARRSRAADAANAARLDHDFRTPIGTLSAALELLRDAPDDAALRSDALNVMSRQIGRLLELTNDVGALEQRLRAGVSR